MKDNIKSNYPAFYICENIIDHTGQLGVIHMDFPRCFVRFNYNADFLYSDFEKWSESIVVVNWLDPKEEWSEEKKQSVLIDMWNFLILHEEEEERQYELMQNEEYF